MIMQKSPRVSIITPAFNAAGYIDETIQAVQAQTVRDWEWLIVDDGSIDDTAVIVEAVNDSRIRLIREEHSGLPAVARNVALARSRAKYIAFLDADDLWVNDKLALQLAYLDTLQDVGLVFSTYYHWDAQLVEPVPIVPNTAELPNPGKYFAIQYRQNVIGNSTVVVRRELLDMHGGLDEDPAQRGTEDYELWLRLAPHTLFGYIEQPLVWYRVHASGISGKRTRMVAGRMLAMDKALERETTLYGDPLLVNRRMSAEKLTWLGYAQLMDGTVVEARQTLLQSLRIWPANLSGWKLLIASSIHPRHYRWLRRLIRRM